MRAGPLSDASIASILNRFYVPVFTANEEYEKTGSAPPEERAAHRRIYLEFLEKKLGTGSFHVYLLAPDGSAIGGLDIGSATQTDKLLARLESTVRQLGTPAGGPLILPGPQSRAPRSYREELVLHLTARGFNQGSWREFPGENWLVLRKRDWSRFLPTPDRPLTVGQSWDLEPRVTTPIYHRFHPQTEDTHDDTARNRIEEQSLRATLVRVDDERGLVWLRGQLRMGRPFYPGRPDATPIQSGVAGFVEFDPRNRRIVDLQLVSENATFGKEGFGVALRTARAPREPLPPGQEQVLFDFEEPDAAEGWNAGPVG
ncbi:MAG: hypothetical protein FJX77_03555, partial [Armatimonadetes bacterium]|nr:hypothetical protein [Armatimonadota bacterium]